MKQASSDPSQERRTAREAAPLRRFLRREDGQVMIEYVLLLVGMWVSVNICIAPLKDALLVFAEDIVRHGGLP